MRETRLQDPGNSSTCCCCYAFPPRTTRKDGGLLPKTKRGRRVKAVENLVVAKKRLSEVFGPVRTSPRKNDTTQCDPGGDGFSQGIADLEIMSTKRSYCVNLNLFKRRSSSVTALVLEASRSKRSDNQRGRQREGLFRGSTEKRGQESFSAHKDPGKPANGGLVASLQHSCFLLSSATVSRFVIDNQLDDLFNVDL